MIGWLWSATLFIFAADEASALIEWNLGLLCLQLRLSPYTSIEGCLLGSIVAASVCCRVDLSAWRFYCFQTLKVP